VLGYVSVICTVRMLRPDDVTQSGQQIKRISMWVSQELFSETGEMERNRN